MAVYFARAETTEFVKIGFAVSVARRITHLQAGCPYRLHVVRTVDGDRSVEGAFHQLFSGRRIERDWFWWEASMQLASAPITAVRQKTDCMKLTAYARKTQLQTAEFKALLAEHGLDVSAEIVRRWLKGEQPPGVKSVAAIEAATQGQVTRYDLRPDIYGMRSASAA